MAKVRVWNDNKYDHKEMFKGEMIEIPSKKYIEMDHEEAVNFRGQYFPVVLDSDGNHTDKGYKMLRIERIEDGQPAPEGKFNPHVCMACQYDATSAKDLAEHSKTHQEAVFVDEAAEAVIKKTRKKAG